MAFDALLKTFIYIVSASLFYPVLFLLVVAFLWVIVFSGGFFGQWLQRTRLEKPRPEDLPGIILNRRVFFWFEKWAKNYMNFIRFAAVLIWLR